VLDAVQDPGNAGTIIRTAAWFGVDALVAGPGTVDFFNPKVVRAAMGGLWDVRLSRTDDLVVLLDRLAAAGFHRYGADLEGMRLRDWSPRVPSVLVLGSEAHGVSPEIAAAVDDRVTITGSPRRHGAESLNVAVAAGILMQHWLG
jgi:TrmH family RNA methyltransferase